MTDKVAWTKKEEDLLFDQYIRKGPTWLSTQINRTATSIKGKAKRLGIITYTPKPWTEEEAQFIIEHYPTKGSQWVCEKLDRTRGSLGKKVRDLGLKVLFYEKKEYSYEDMFSAVSQSSNMSDLCAILGKVKSGASYRVIKRNIFRHRIDISHFKTTRFSVSKNHGRPIEHYLTYGSNITSNNLKKKLYKEGLKQRQCEKCGQGEDWNGEHMSLILDHVNGDPKDNTRENLRIVCPNCNATLSTHCRGKKALIAGSSS